MQTHQRHSGPQRTWLAVTLAAAAVAILVPLSGTMRPASAEQATVIPPPAKDEALAASSRETAIFSGGCFWGVQAVYQHTDGVISAVSGYSGGEKGTAIYEVVTNGTTGHAESVEVTYDPSKISYGKLLQIFFSVAHNPTQLNYQGPDRGTQYRSAIWTTNESQAISPKPISRSSMPRRLRGPDRNGGRIRWRRSIRPKTTIRITRHCTPTTCTS